MMRVRLKYYTRVRPMRKDTGKVECTLCAVAEEIIIPTTCQSAHLWHISSLGRLETHEACTTHFREIESWLISITLLPRAWGLTCRELQLR